LQQWFAILVAVFVEDARNNCSMTTTNETPAPKKASQSWSFLFGGIGALEFSLNK
jgi:hypothetical protein